MVFPAICRCMNVFGQPVHHPFLHPSIHRAATAAVCAAQESWWQRSCHRWRLVALSEDAASLSSVQPHLLVAKKLSTDVFTALLPLSPNHIDSSYYDTDHLSDITAAFEA